MTVDNTYKSRYKMKKNEKKYKGAPKTEKKIKSSIVESSGIRPAAFMVTARDRRVNELGSKLIQFGDDTYPSS